MLPPAAVLYLKPQRYFLASPALITKPLILSSWDNTTHATLSCLPYTLHALIIKNTQLSMSSISITDCALDYAVLSYSSHLSLFSVHIANNSAGGIHLFGQHPDVTLSNCLFENNHAYRGSGLFALDFAYITMTNTTFQFNNSTQSGGGLRLNNFSHLDADNCTFAFNTAGSGGAVFLNDNAHAVFTNSVFANNTASDDGGGAVYMDDNSRMKMFRCNITHNAYRNRRGLWDHNYGGGMMFTDDDTRAVFHSCEIHHNEANFGGGGALSQDDDSEVSFFNCNFTHNRGTQGGVFYLDDDAKLHVEDSSLTRNRCDFTGGILRGTGDAHMVFVRTWMMKNLSPTPDSSSFGFFDGHTTLTLEQSIVGSSRRDMCPFNFTINNRMKLDAPTRAYICSEGCAYGCEL